MIQETPSFCGICDNCGEIFDDGQFSLFPLESDAKDAMKDSEWYVDGTDPDHKGKHYCPACFTPHPDIDDKIIVDETRKDHELETQAPSTPQSVEEAAKEFVEGSLLMHTSWPKDKALLEEQTEFGVNAFLAGHSFTQQQSAPSSDQLREALEKIAKKVGEVIWENVPTEHAEQMALYHIKHFALEALALPASPGSGWVRVEKVKQLYEALGSVCDNLQLGNILEADRVANAAVNTPLDAITKTT